MLHSSLGEWTPVVLKAFCLQSCSLPSAHGSVPFQLNFTRSFFQNLGSNNLSLVGLMLLLSWCEPQGPCKPRYCRCGGPLWEAVYVIWALLEKLWSISLYERPIVEEVPKQTKFSSQCELTKSHLNLCIGVFPAEWSTCWPRILKLTKHF